MTAQLVAHGVGGRQDLPIPFSFALVGSAVAVAISFAVTALLWRTSRLRGDQAGRPIPTRLQAVVDSPALRAGLCTLGLVVTAFVVVTAIFGSDDARNPAPGFVYVLLWVGLVPASLLFGPVWRLLNPLRTIHGGLAALMGTRPERGLREYPDRLGHWPAAVGLLGFTWLELVAPTRTEASTLVAAMAVYGGVQLVGALVFGSSWFARGDAFEVYSALIGRLAPFGRRADGRLVLRNPLDGLDGLRPEPGLVAVVCVLLGSTAYDSFSNAPMWVQATQDQALSPTVLGTVGIVTAIALVAALFAVGIGAAGAAGSTSRRGLLPAFAHSIVPIAVGYLVAHYFSLLIFEGQRTLILAADPLASGASLFGAAGRQVDFALLSTTTIATIQVLAVVAGHVVGVVAAHDRAVRLFPTRHAVIGQLPLLVLMICYTIGGLTLLFAA